MPHELQKRVRRELIRAHAETLRLRPDAICDHSVFAWLADERAALTVASAGVALYATGIVIWRGRQFLRAGGNRTPTAMVLFILGPTAALLFLANALVFASLAVFALALCVQLSVAAVSVYSLVSAAEA